MLDLIAGWITRHERLGSLDCPLECVGPPRWWLPRRVWSWALARVIASAASRTEIPLEEEHGEML